MFALIAVAWKAQIEFRGRQVNLTCRCAMILKMLSAYVTVLKLQSNIGGHNHFSSAVAKSKIESQKFDCCDGGPNTGSKSRKWPPRVLDEAFDVPG